MSAASRLWTKYARYWRGLTSPQQKAVDLAVSAGLKAAGKFERQTRQRVRCALRAKAFRLVQQSYGPEPRRARRLMARRMAARWWRERTLK